MPTPRKHAELIKKWADDNSIVIQYKHGDGNWYYDRFPTFIDSMEFRIKPDVIRYRVALLLHKEVQVAYTEELENYLQQSRLFVKWLTDWVEVEI